MKFLYEYNTKDNVRRRDVVSAADREAAFRELRAMGIRPFNVTEAPGFLNKLLGKGKRWLAIGLLGIGCLVLTALVLSPSRTSDSASPDTPMPRHQIYGDPALMEEMERTGYTNVLAQAGDRLLARFAQPGVPVILHGSRQEMESLADALAAAIAVPDAEAVPLKNDDVREVRELKLTVLWMRGELRRYLANGIGTPRRYISRLGERQQREVSLYANAMRDLEKSDDPALWDRINASLRNAGLKTVAPKEKPDAASGQ